MKLFWKLLAGMLGIMIVSFAVFGTVLLQTFFQIALDKETESGLDEVRVLQYAFLAAAEGLGESYQLNERMVGQLAESVVKNAGGGKNNLCVYGADGRSVYPPGRMAGELYGQLSSRGRTAAENCAWRLTEEADGHWMEAMARVECGGETYYLGVRRNTDAVYESRESIRRKYRGTLLVLAAVAALLSAAFAAGFTAPVRRLSFATKAFSRGRYEKRVKPRGNDEIAGLMQDFNLMADRLEENIHELEENARRQEEFTGAFAHELKTPLTSMIGYGEMLMTMELDEGDRRQAADYIYRESRRLERLAYKMMELIHIGKIGIEARPVPTEELRQRLIRLVAARIGQKQLHFSCRLKPAVLTGDIDLLLSLLGNLVDNGCKACGEGGSIRVEGETDKEGEKACYRITVTDNGRGIPPEELSKITEAFYMVDKSRARREGGAGLGMAICARIIEAHGASWEIASAPGAGTVVTMRFALREEAVG